MKLDIAIELNNKNRVTGFLTSGKYIYELYNLTPLNTIKKIQEFISINEEINKTIGDRIEELLNDFEVGETRVVDIIGSDVKIFRVRLTMISKEIGKKFKTKYKNGMITITRIK